ncbi:MAG: hypothetical protein GY940_15210 [bacterium]|nr:hypothetical protein [bacterium]
MNSRTKNKTIYGKRGAAGFTVAEMVIVLAVVAILAGLITPLAVNVITQNRINACIKELTVIKQAIVGDPSLVEGGSRSSFGYVGDMGVLPGALDDLVNQGSQTGTTTTSGVMWGWRGPYVNEVNDAWGRAYNYSTDPAVTGSALISVLIWSAGQDGVSGTGDDISITIRQDEVTSFVTGNTLDGDGAGTDCTITVYAPNGTTVQTYILTPTTTTNPVYSSGAQRFPIGIRRIEFTKGVTTYPFSLNLNNGPITVVNFREP